MKCLYSLAILLMSPIFCLGEENNGLEMEIVDVMKKYQAVGLSVVVVKDNRLFYSRSFGYNPNYNDTTRRDSIPSNGIYVIASISKSFIATAIMQLVEKKQLNLDDNVNNYLDFKLFNPQYPEIPITVRMLLSQRSSITDRHYSRDINQINPLQGKYWKECYNDYKPGTKFEYCNFNYNLLGAVIEKATGKRFFDYIDENIMDPLGLNASYNLTKLDSTMLVRAYEYDYKTKKNKIVPDLYNCQYYRKILKDYKLGSSTGYFIPTGGVRISVTDLAKYMIMHMNYGDYNGKRIISRESELEMWRPQGEDFHNSYFSQYGLSFSRWKNVVDGESFVGIVGGSHGIHSAMYFNPEKKYGFIVICNGCTYDTKMKDSIVKILYNHFIIN